MKEDITSLMIYRGISAQIRYDERDHVFVGRVIDTPDNLISFEGDTFGSLRADFRAAVDDYLSDRPEAEKRLADAITPVQLPQDIRNAAAAAAESSGRSIDQWVRDAVINAIHN